MKLQNVAVILTNITVTFVQAAFAAWALVGFKTDKIVLGGVIGAGLSALWNTLLKPLFKEWGWLRKDA